MKIIDILVISIIYHQTLWISPLCNIYKCIHDYITDSIVATKLLTVWHKCPSKASYIRDTTGRGGLGLQGGAGIYGNINICIVFFNSKLATAAKSRKLRKKSEMLFLEGSFLIEEAFKAGVPITHIFFSKIEHLQSLPLDTVNIGQGQMIRFCKVNYNYLKIWSDVHVPSGIIGMSMMCTVSIIYIYIS